MSQSNKVETTLRKGVYYIPDTDNICFFENVREFEDLKSHFYILTWHHYSGVYPKTMIEQEQVRYFVRIGDL